MSSLLQALVLVFVSRPEPEVAPPPVPLGTGCHEFGGKVVEVGPAFIGVQGLNLVVSARPDTLPDGRSPCTLEGEVAVYEAAGLGGRDAPVATGVKAVTTRDRVTVTTAGGAVVSIRREDQPVRRFRASGPLAAGRPPAGQAWGHGYTLADVKVGDEVVVGFVAGGSSLACRWVSIKLRPGGRVPADPGEPAGPGVKYHQVQNARVDWEENGIPVPMKFLPPYPPAPR
jgi:hypothetical protein